MIVTNASVWRWHKNISKEIFTGSVIDNCSFRVVNGIIVGLTTSILAPEQDDVIIDAKGKLIIPGLNDSHIHINMLGESSYFVNLGKCESIYDLKEVLRSHHRMHPELQFIIGVNWDQSKLSRYPTAADLDEVSREVPIWIWRVCWHIGCANSKLLSECNINEGKEISGGLIDCDEKGIPTGILRERAVEIIQHQMDRKTHEDKKRFIEEGLTLAIKCGLTAVQTNDSNSFKIYKELLDSDRLHLRIFLTPDYDDLAKTEAHVGESLIPLRSSNFHSSGDLSSKDTFLVVERVKIFCDGSLGAETAALFSDQVEGAITGVLIHEIGYLCGIIRKATEKGFRIEVHAIGDAAAAQVLDAIQISKDAGIIINRPIITHCQVLNIDVITAMARNDVIANVQPSFVPTDMKWVQDRLSPSALAFSYAWKTLLLSGVVVAGGSDSPIESW